LGEGHTHLLELKLDCRHYRGDKPCVHCRLCADCTHYDAWGKRILIIKTAAMGDVLRTTSILPALHNKYPGAKITWLTGENAEPLLRGNPDIAEIVLMDGDALPKLMPRRFDIVLSLDKTPAECGIAMMMYSGDKRGIGLGPEGVPYPLNPEAEYYFSLGLSDELKFKKNKKTYIEMILEVCGLDADARAHPEIYLSGAEVAEAKKHLAAAGFAFDARAVGIVAGAGDTFAKKTPSAEKWAGIIHALESVLPKSERLYILGGPADLAKMNEVAGAVPGAATVIPPLANPRVFAGVVALMNALVCGDTLAMHIAAAVRAPAIVLFGPTCGQEIDLFGMGAKIVSQAECAPCYKGACSKSPDCMDMIAASYIARAAAEVLSLRADDNRK
jgi:ADP-heptose:LPS heptosyltransferase